MLLKIFNKRGAVVKRSPIFWLPRIVSTIFFVICFAFIAFVAFQYVDNIFSSIIEFLILSIPVFVMISLFFIRFTGKDFTRSILYFVFSLFYYFAYFSLDGSSYFYIWVIFPYHIIFYILAFIGFLYLWSWIDQTRDITFKKKAIKASTFVLPYVILLLFIQFHGYIFNIHNIILNKPFLVFSYRRANDDEYNYPDKIERYGKNKVFASELAVFGGYCSVGFSGSNYSIDGNKLKLYFYPSLSDLSFCRKSFILTWKLYNLPKNDYEVIFANSSY